jgi:MFS transporter, SP family, xylose:H+ symportor
MISTVAALGGLLFGYDFVVIGGAKPFYEQYFHITDPTTQGWAMSCALACSAQSSRAPQAIAGAEKSF